jgi:HD domain-containing protein
MVVVSFQVRPESPQDRGSNGASGVERLFERFFMPPVRPADLADALTDAPVRTDDYRRMVYFVALVAVGFFIPSLIMADVPFSLWGIFTVGAGLAGVVIGGSFVVIRQGSRWSYVAVVVNLLVLSALATLYGTYYNQIGLAIAMVICAHAVLHGLGPALLGVLLGGAIVPYVIQHGQPVNSTDPIYAVIYLFGAALMTWSGRNLARRRADALRSQLALTQATEREAVLILARAAEVKDEVTGDHVARVGDLSYELGARAGLTLAEAEDLRFAAMLHDVGKLHLPDRILNKPGRLTREEWSIVQQHTIWGERILGSTDGFELARRVARWHHENFDGTGYPDELHGTDIPLVARIVRLADVYDALRSERPYKPAWSLARSLEELEQRAGELFDPDLTRIFVTYLEQQGPELEQARRILSLHARQRLVARARAPAFVSIADSAL